MSGFSETAVLVHVTYAEGKNGRQLPESTRKRVFVNPFSVSAASSTWRTRRASARAIAPDARMRLPRRGNNRVSRRSLAITDVSRGGRGEFVRLTCSQKVADDG